MPGVALVEAFAHSFAVAAAVEMPPLAVIEVYNATRCWIDAATEYNAGFREETRDREEREMKEIGIEKERSE